MILLLWNTAVTAVLLALTEGYGHPPRRPFRHSLAIWLLPSFALVLLGEMAVTLFQL